MERERQILNHQQSKIKRRIKVTVLYLFILIMTEYLLRELLFKKSLNFMIWIQRNMSQITPLMRNLTLLGGDKFFIVLIMLFYNFANVYKSLILLFVVTTSSYINNILKMIYLSPRPYWVNDNIFEYVCEAGWGNPSGHSLSSTAIYMTIWKLTFSNNEYRNKKTFKKISFFGVIILIILIMFSRLILGQHSLNQVIFGALLGVGLYYFTFGILKPDSNSPNELFYIISQDDLIIFSINFILLVGTLIGYFGFAQINENKILYRKIVSEKCKDVDYCRSFEHEALIGCLLIHLIWVAILGIRHEFYSLKCDIVTWIKINFSQTSVGDYEHYQKINQNLLQNLDPLLNKNEMINNNYFPRSSQWNHTNGKVTLGRIFFSLIILLIILLPYFFISCNGNMLFISILKYFLPLSFLTYFSFSYYKQFLGIFNLTN